MPGSSNALTIPEKCGVILLPDTVLFPHGALPLHIFEPRYRQMLSDSLQGDCLFCVGNLLGEERPAYDECVAPIGTIGLIRSSQEKDDGTSDLLLHGVFRVRFLSWPGGEKDYPLARIEPVIHTTLTASEEKEDSQALRDAVNQALSQFPDDVIAQVNTLLDRTDNAATLSDAVAQQFVHDPNLRQTLLDTANVRKRISHLIRFLKNASRPT